MINNFQYELEEYYVNLSYSKMIDQNYTFFENDIEESYFEKNDE